MRRASGVAGGLLLAATAAAGAQSAPGRGGVAAEIAKVLDPFQGQMSNHGALLASPSDNCETDLPP